MLLMWKTNFLLDAQRIRSVSDGIWCICKCALHWLCARQLGWSKCLEFLGFSIKFVPSGWNRINVTQKVTGKCCAERNWLICARLLLIICTTVPTWRKYWSKVASARAAGDETALVNWRIPLAHFCEFEVKYAYRVRTRQTSDNLLRWWDASVLVVWAIWRNRMDVSW